MGDMYKLIAEQTNLNASQERTILRKGKRVKIKTRNWVNITVKVVKAYFGYFIWMGIH